MRILQICYIFPPPPEVGDGITNVAIGLSRTLAKRGHEVSVYTSDRLDLKTNRRLEAGVVRDKNLDIRYLRSRFAFGTFIVTPSIHSLLKKTINEYDIVHIHDIRSVQGITASIHANRTSTPYVYQPHGSFLSMPPIESHLRLGRAVLDRCFSRRAIIQASKILALNITEAAGFQKNFGLDKNRISLVPNGIDLELLPTVDKTDDFRRYLGIPQDSRIVLYLGRIHRSKGISLLIKSFETLSRLQDGGVFLVLAGPDGGYTAHALSLADHLGVRDQIRVTGFLTRYEKHLALRDSDVFVTPIFYGFPVTFLEAGASGLPIVTTSLGDNLDWIDNKAGYVCSPNPDAIAHSIHSILSSGRLRSQLSTGGIRQVRAHFTVDAVVDRIEQIYSSILSEKKTTL